MTTQATFPCARCHKILTHSMWFSETCPLQPGGHTLGNTPILDWPVLHVVYANLQRVRN